MKLCKKVFIFTEPVKETVLARIPFTMIHPAYIVMIGEKYYRVLDESKGAGTQRPTPFQLRKKDGTVRGWRFEGREITNEETLKGLEDRKIACLVLNPENIEEVAKPRRYKHSKGINSKTPTIQNMEERIKICKELRKQGFSYLEIAKKLGVSKSQVNYYLHYERGKAYQRKYARRKREEYRQIHPQNQRIKETKEQITKRFKSYLERHNFLVKKVAQQLNGEVFSRAPFDIIAPNGDFYEVKVTNEIRPHMIQRSLRFRLTEPELKFMELTKERYHVILIQADGQQASAWLIGYSKLEKWSSRLKLRKDTWHLDRPFKTFELSKKRLEALKPFKFTQNQASYY